MLNNKRNLWIFNHYTIALASHSRSKQHKIKGNISEELIDDIQYICIKSSGYKENNIGIVVSPLSINGIAKSTKSFIKNISELKRKKILGMTKLFNCIRSL